LCTLGNQARCRGVKADLIEDLGSRLQDGRNAPLAARLAWHASQRHGLAAALRILLFLRMSCLSVMDSRVHGCWSTLHVRPPHHPSETRGKAGVQIYVRCLGFVKVFAS